MISLLSQVAAVWIAVDWYNSNGENLGGAFVVYVVAGVVLHVVALAAVTVLALIWSAIRGEDR